MTRLKLRLLIPAFFLLSGLYPLSTATSGTACSHPPVRPGNLRTDGQTAPLATDNPHPRLTWRLPAVSIAQTAYRVEASSDADFSTPDLWNSGKVAASSPACIYRGKSPAPGKPVYWRVRIFAADGKQSEWSEPARFENGLQAPQEWTGPWIGMDSTARGNKAAYLRGTVRLAKPVTAARAYVCAPGWYELYVNGHNAGQNSTMSPAQTDYEQRCLYVPTDIDSYLTDTPQQDVELGVILGDGWYSQRIAWGTDAMRYGEPRLRAQFIFNHPDGTQTSAPADLTWRAATGPIGENNVYRGEVYDARREIPQWGVNDYASWQPVTKYPAPGPETRLEPQSMPPERLVREVAPVSVRQVTETDGEQPWVYDFGENLTGWCRLQLHDATPGTRLRIEFAEKINPDGTLFRTPVGNEVNGTVQVDYYTAKGACTETWEPRFTFHGFQYAALYVESGSLPEPPSAATLAAVVVHTDLRQTGSFNCSDPQLNRLHEAAGRTLLAGMHGLPMDCPVRERCGWLGDGHAMAAILLTRYDAANFLHKYARDILTGGIPVTDEPRVGPVYGTAVHERKPTGVPHMITPGKRLCGTASPDWGSAQVFIPWEIYIHTGDERILREFLQPMQIWVDYLSTIADPATGLLTTGLGDWCSPAMRRAAESGTPWIGNAEIPILTSGMYIRCCRILARTEAILGNRPQAEARTALADSLGRKLAERWFLPPNQQTEYSQTALAYAYNYCDPALLPRETIVAKLVALCDEGRHFDAGIFGTTPMLHILAREGRGDIALRLLTKPEYPSYRAMLDLGATTFWEYWPVRGSEGGYEDYDGSMSHPMHAAFDEWFYTGIAGLAARDGICGPWTFRWNDFPGLEWASASGRMPEGPISSAWRRDGKQIVWRIEVPAGAQAKVVIPSPAGEIRKNGQPLADKVEAGCTRTIFTTAQPGQELTIGPGIHEFSFPAPTAETIKQSN